MKRSFRLLVLIPLALGAAAVAGDEPLLFAGRETLTLEAGQHVAFRWLPDRRGFAIENRPTGPAALPEAAASALRRVPEWLRDDTRRQFERLLLTPIRIENGPARPSFRDVNGDGVEDLVILGKPGARTTHLGPHWIRTEEEFESTGFVAEIQDPARGDVDGDGRLDEVKGAKDGRILWRRNRGARGEDGFLDFRTDARRTFPHSAGMASRPAFYGARLVVGNLDGKLSRYRRGKEGVYAPAKKKAAVKAPEGLGGFAAPALGKLTGGKGPDLVVGDETGALFGPGLDPAKHRVTSFASPCLADLDGDGDLDIVCGSGDGTLTVFRNTGSAGKPAFEPGGLVDLNLITEDVGDSSAPAAGDLNGDGNVDLIVGNQAGELRVLLGPDWREDKTVFAGLDFGEMAAPALAAGEDGMRLAVGRLDGDLLFYTITTGDDGRIRTEESGSWDFTPDQRSKDIAAYYERVYSPEWKEMRGANDADAVAVLAKVLAAAPTAHADEIAFAIAFTPAEVLRAMVRMGNADLLAVNAERVYTMAAQVKYAKLVEGEDHTTIAYRTEDGWTPAPRDIYYWWVVHPRILYEIPARVNESYWQKSAEDRGQTDSEWWKHEPEAGIHASPAVMGDFWRKAFENDGRFGKTLWFSIVEARTLREAQLLTHRFLAKNAGGIGLMRFGYETQDLQPWLIYAKHYGSCGEHSIIGAAAARTMLIPASVVGCRGEDHQWNEWWDVDGKWHHWDCCGKDGIDTPWGSSEGLNHKAKTVSTVTRWRGDDTHDHTTGTVHNDPKVEYTTKRAGYTDVCDVTVIVTDPKARPVDGALVVVRSHWNRRNLISTWGYTDFRGEVKFGLGFEPHGGYTIDALTPLGPCGVVNFPVAENEARTLTLTTPNEKPAFARGDRVKAPATGGGAGSLLTARIEASEITPPNFITSKRYRIGDHLTKKWGYRGTHRSIVPVDPAGGPEVLIFAPEEYERFAAGEECTPVHRAPLATDGRLAWPDWADREYVAVLSNRRALMARVRVRVEEQAALIPDKTVPVVEIDGGGREVNSGEAITITGRATDDRGVTRVVSSSTARGPEERDLTDEFDAATGDIRFVFDAGAGGPLPPGEYIVRLRARDAAGGWGEAEITVRVNPSRVFRNQKIRQDDPENPLESCSWVLGPFDLAGTDRFFLVRTKSGTPEFDMDMHLYFDKNGNGRVDGATERIAQSTSPTATERIYLEKPAAGTYWLYCQGWQVKGDVALLDVEIFPLGRRRWLGPFSPVGPIAAAPSEIVAKFPPPAVAKEGGIRFLFDGTDVTKDCEIGPDSIRYLPKTSLAENEPHRVAVRIETVNGGEEERKFGFTIDTVPPTLDLLLKPAGTEPEDFLEVVATDAVGPVTVTCRTPDGKDRRMKPAGKDRPGVFLLELPVQKWKKGEHVLTITARDAVGLETKKEYRLTAP